MNIHDMNLPASLATDTFKYLTRGVKMTMIVAMDEEGGISKDGKIPWGIPEDMRYFAEFTSGKQLLMGRKTAESLPMNMKNRDRFIHVLSRNAESFGYCSPEPLCTKEFILDHHSYSSLGHFFANAGDWLHLRNKQRELRELVVCGGTSVYAALAPMCDELHISRIPGRYNCDKGTGYWLDRGNQDEDGNLAWWKLQSTTVLDGPNGVEVDVYVPRNQ